jgi:glycosyltransferase involved in cell wall biosynthesis
MKKLPSVSVVIPSYNYGRFIAAAIDSALGQTHRPLEIIVVDDGSTDDTFEQLQAYRDRVCVIQQKNRGPSAARNAGISAARGEWIAFLDADDIWFPNKLQLQMECAVKYPQVCIIGAYNDARPASDAANLFTLLGTSDFLGGLPFGTSSVVVKKEKLLWTGLFNESRRYVEDRELWLKLTMCGAGARVNTALWHYRIHPNQCNANSERMAENYRDVLDEFFAAHPEHIHQRPAAYAYYNYDTAMSYHGAGRNFAAMRYLFASFLCHVNPLKRGNSETRFIRSALLLKTILGMRLFVAAMSMRRWLQSVFGRAPQTSVSARSHCAEPNARA